MKRILLSAFSDEYSADFGEQIAALGRLGIRYMEIRGVDGRNVSELSAAEAKTCAARLADAGISVSAVGSPIGKMPLGGDWLALAAQYYETLSTFVTDVRPTVVGHYDLIEKFNENGVLFDSLDPRYLDIAKRHIDRILVHCPDVLFEVNTGAMYRCGKAQPYPAPPLLRYLCEKGAKVIVTSDSHNTASLDFAFDTALDCIRSAGFREVWELRRVDGKAVARATAV